MCYTYAIKHNDTLDICEDNEATNVLLGICDHERPRFKPRKLQKSIMSIEPNKYHATSFKPRRKKLTLKIETDDDVITDEEFTLCIKNVNKLGITSNVAQYTASDGNIVSCSYLPNHIGLPCRSNTNPPPSSSNVNDERNTDTDDDDAAAQTDAPYVTTSIPSPPISDRGYSGKTNPDLESSEITTTLLDIVSTNESSAEHTISATIAPTASATDNTLLTTKEASFTATIEPIVSSTNNAAQSTSTSAIIAPISSTITPTTAPSSQPPSTFAPSAKPTASSADICIIVDQSCGFTESQCDAYLDWIIEFIIDLRDGFYPRLCLLGMSHGVQVFVDLTQEISVMNMIEIIRAQNCGDTNTNLFDALQVAQDKLNGVYPQSEMQSVVIFSSCSSTDHFGAFNEHQICRTFSDNPVIIEVDFYVINIMEGRADLNPYNYLNCLLNDNMERKVILNANNSANATQIITNIALQIVSGKIHDDNHVIHAANAHMMSVVDEMRDDDEGQHIEYEMSAFSESTRNVIECLFIMTVICMILNAFCCTICALRQSGALDPCFGAIDKGVTDDDDVTDNEDANMSPDDLDDAHLKIMHSQESLYDDIKLKRCLQVKQSQNFQNIMMMKVNHMEIDMKPKLYNQ